MLTAWTYLQTRLTRDEGASLVEYALLLVLIAVAAFIGMNQLGSSVNTEFKNVASTIVSP